MNNDNGVEGRLESKVTRDSLEENANVTDCKLQLNQIIWTYAPGGTTLREAEELAVDLLTKILVFVPGVRR